MENNNLGERKSLGDFDRLEKQKGVTKKEKYQLLTEIYNQVEDKPEGIDKKRLNMFQKIAEKINKGK